MGRVGTIEREPGQYFGIDQEDPGDKRVAPVDYCERLEIDPPPMVTP
ncbi:MAG: hypothetical protein ABW168_22465 [Sedimenticola sp.]